MEHINFSKKFVSSWSSFKRPNETGGGEKRLHLASPNAIEVVDMELVEDGKKIEILISKQSIIDIKNILININFYFSIYRDYRWENGTTLITPEIYKKEILTAINELELIDSPVLFSVKNDGSRVYLISTEFLKSLSKVCIPEKSGFVLDKKEDSYSMRIFYDSDVLKDYNVDSVQSSILFQSKELNNICLNFLSLTNLIGLKFEEELVQRFVASIVTKPFVLLTGLSGSGKTKLAQAFAMWICESKEQYRIIPVGADWTNREPLLGFPNALKDDEYTKPDNKVLDLLMDARDNHDKPYFLILDEMNLSHVERYFADFLSTMESKEDIPLHDLKNEESGVPSSIALPRNLFIIGTVNIDETTYMFSPKVLDRANTIEFRVDRQSLKNFLEKPKSVDLEKLSAQGTSMSESFISRVCDDKDCELEDKIQEEILKFFEELQRSGAEFGYRTALEISKLITLLEEFGMKVKDDRIDVAIMQKMLPKLHGSRSKLNRVLKPLAKLCLINDEKLEELYFKKYEDIDFENDPNIKYKLSFEKIMRMHNNAKENGYASYAEA